MIARPQLITPRRRESPPTTRERQIRLGVVARDEDFSDIYSRVARLRELSNRLAPWTLWLSALKKLVVSHNDEGRFDDILEHPAMADLELDGVPNVLAGCSIAEISVLYEYLLATEDMSAKRENGQFFTPDDVAQFMARQADNFPHGVWLDPCCGIGNLAFWLIARQQDPERFLLESMKFIDLDARALLTARVLLTVAFQRSELHLFSQLESSFAQADFLSVPSLDTDYILMNPPYVQASPPSSIFEAGASRDMYAYFLERALKESKGVIAITPQTFTHSKRHLSLRTVLLRSATDITIYCFDNVPDNIFKGYKFGTHNTNTVNSTRAAVLVAQRESHSEGRFRITPLLRWRSTQRAAMFAGADSLLSQPIRVSPEIFPKLPPGLEAFYEDLISNGVPLAELLSQSGPEHLVVPTTPRYFISAVRRPLDRASIRCLAFRTAEDSLRAYLTLNSSIAYFWWRVRDGGMTLSAETLLSVPIDPSLDPTTPEARRLIRALEASEEVNLVVKVNSGRLNENVKHPLDLVHSLNQLLAPGHADALLTLHMNSYIP